jgi:carboxyl-terminal processing protease
MNTRKAIRCMALALAAASWMSVQAATPSWAELRRSPKEVIDEVWQIVHREYVDPDFNKVDWLDRRQELLARDYATDSQAYQAITSALKSLGDPYTRFMDPDQFASMQVETSGELVGVGMQLGTEEGTERLVVIAPTDGSPASKAGIQPGDIITAIDGTSTDGMDINQAVERIRGEVGTPVKVSILRGNKPLEFRMTREVIELRVVNHELRREGNQRVGYIRLSQFSAVASAEMRDALKELESQSATGYVLDLRANPGGLLFAGAEIARMFLKRGAIVSIEDRVGVREQIVANNTAITDKPLAIIVDNGSASASEILAGAMRDNNRATLVGTKTFGKGSVQAVHELSGGAGMTITTARYRTPNGTDINHKGIVPDVIVDLSQTDIAKLNQSPDAIATMADPQYAAAVNALQTRLASQL